MYTTVHSISNNSAVVDWSRPSDPNGIIEGYHLYFLSGNFTDVKTIKSKDPRMEYNLTGLAPSSMYYVWIRAFTWKHEGESSTKLSVRTDVTSPSMSSVTNISCLSDNSVNVQWTSCSWYQDTPSAGPHCVYHVKLSDETSGVDTIIFINSTTDDMASDTLEMTTDPLAPDTTYSISVRAGSVSMYRSETVYHSDWSLPVHLHLQDGCHMSYAPHSEYETTDNTVTADHVNLRPGVIAGIVVTSVLIVIIITAILVWHKFCKESYYYLDESGSSSTANNIATQWETEVQHRVTAEQFLAQVKNLHLEDDKEFVVHFKNVTNNTRTVNNLCSYEQPFYVDGFNQPKAFMASPLPLPYKFNFFWKQIWEQKVSVIVMLENIVENGKVKL